MHTIILLITTEVMTDQRNVLSDSKRNVLKILGLSHNRNNVLFMKDFEAHLTGKDKTLCTSLIY